MAQAVFIVVLMPAALLINTLSYCSAENVYCVTPTATSCSSCPHDSTHCDTLSKYAREAELYFTSNTTMAFLPGDHLLDKNITVANVARLTMRGEPSSSSVATIVCKWSVGLSFTNMIEFQTHSLAFASCSRKIDSPSAIYYALLLHSTQFAELVNCSFHNNLGTALVVNNTGVTLAGNSEFSHNHCGDDLCAGGGVIAVHSNLTFQGNTTFLENRGGAISLLNTALSFSGTNHFIRNSAQCGGAIYTNSSVISFSGNSNLIGNSANFGGAIYPSENTVLSFTGTNNFINNSAGYDGGAIYAIGNIVNFSGTTNLINNVAWRHGGAICTFESTSLSFNGTNNFISNLAAVGGAIIAAYKTVHAFVGANNFTNNSAYFGGAIYTEQNAVLGFKGTNNFIHNLAYENGGAIYAIRNPSLSFIGTSNFTNNLAVYGGAISLQNTTHILSFKGATNFINNSAKGLGGSVYAVRSTLLSFNGTNNFIRNTATFGGAIVTLLNTKLSFNGTNNFISNSAYPTHSGGAIYTLENTVNTFNGNNTFISNSAYFGGAIYAYRNTEFILYGTSNFINNSGEGLGGAINIQSTSGVSVNGLVKFINNSALHGGAICARGNSSLTFSGTIYFTSNKVRIGEVYGMSNARGGGVFMGVKSTFSILPATTMYWENNHATLGGAIYVRDASPMSYCDQEVSKEECFFQLPGQSLPSLDVKLVFKNNSADSAGSVLYGGAIDNCKLTGMDSSSSGEVFDMIFHIEDDTDGNTTSNISSDPLKICPCENNLPNCSMPIEREVYPGETFQVSVIALGQRNGTVPSTVSSIIYIGTGVLKDSQYLQQTRNSCTKLNYTIYSLSQSVDMEMHAEGSPCSTYKILAVSLDQTCPPGFKISESKRSCVCVPRLAHYAHLCNIINGTGLITRQSGQQFWIGYDNTSDDVILHPHCPFDHCVNDTVVFSLDDTDLQCAYNKSGLLCGHCKEGYSLVLGAPQCRKCTNRHLLLLIPFAVMGVTLVFLLFVCKLTVVTGTLSGLVFYANIVGPNRNIFLPVESTNAFSIFIAWLNLDFGVVTCFYDGLDTYSKTWLQFVFPVYIWVLVGLMIVVSRFSQKFAKLLGNNPVSVLATLILLSYTKILRTLITVFYVTYLEYPTYDRMVWLYDGNIDYLSSKHIPLFVVAILVFLFLFLPYTLLLLFGQWLPVISHLRLFSWVNNPRLKPFMDAYHAPYKAKHRYWPGLLLVLRFILLLVFAFQFNPQPGRASINLLAILVGAGILQLWAWISGGVYKTWCLDALEGSFVLNLIILVGATSYAKRAGGNQLAVGYTSVSIAFATFIGILIYHLANVTGVIQFLIKKCTTETTRNRDQAEAEVKPSDDHLPDRLVNPGEYEPVERATADPAEEKDLLDEEQKKLLPVYNYGTMN